MLENFIKFSLLREDVIDDDEKLEKMKGEWVDLSKVIDNHRNTAREKYKKEG